MAAISSDEPSLREMLKSCERPERNYIPGISLKHHLAKILYLQDMFLAKNMMLMKTLNITRHAV